MQVFEINLKTDKHEELIDITHLISEIVKKNNIDNGRALIYIPHTTAGVTINENADPSVRRDIIYGLKSLNLESLNFQHMEGNSPSHIKATLVGNSASIIINNGRLLLGTWQGVYFCEFDGPRNRKVIIQI